LKYIYFYIYKKWFYSLIEEENIFLDKYSKSHKKLGVNMAKANPIEIQKHLKGIDYPASKQELVSHAQEQKGDRQVISLLEKLPDNEEFESPTDVNQAIAEI
jgi:hypothetical protein